MSAPHLRTPGVRVVSVDPRGMNKVLVPRLNDLYAIII